MVAASRRRRRWRRAASAVACLSWRRRALAPASARARPFRRATRSVHATARRRPVAARRAGVADAATTVVGGAIALQADPTKDIKSLQNINWVMKDGIIYKDLK